MASDPESRLYLLAFDHRDAFRREWLGIDGKPTAEEALRISRVKEVILDGLLAAVEDGVDREAAGALIDEESAGPARLVERVKAAGITLAMPAERSGQREFELEYGERFAEHIERFDPDFVKVLVRYNPAGDRELNARQVERLAALSAWLRNRGRRLLFELLVPAEPHQAAASDDFDVAVRPRLMVQAIAELQSARVEPSVWKLEGLDRREDCERVVAQARAGGRDHVSCVVLGRGADPDTVRRWLRVAAAVDGFAGFAIGRTIWGDPLARYLAAEISRDDAVAEVARRYGELARVFAAASDALRAA